MWKFPHRQKVTRPGSYLIWLVTLTHANDWWFDNINKSDLKTLWDTAVPSVFGCKRTPRATEDGSFVCVLWIPFIMSSLTQNQKVVHLHRTGVEAWAIKMNISKLWHTKPQFSAQWNFPYKQVRKTGAVWQLGWADVLNQQQRYSLRFLFTPTTCGQHYSEKAKQEWSSQNKSIIINPTLNACCAYLSVFLGVENSYFSFLAQL